MATPIEVRDVAWNDFDDLRENYYACYDERDAGLPIGIGLFADRPSVETESEWFADQYRQTLSGTAIGLVAVTGGRAVGACFVGTRGGAGSESAHVGELGILVHHAYRSQGVGTALLASMIERCRGRFESIFLSVFSTNDGAKRLYRRLGFVPCGALPRGIKRGETYIDVEWMVLTL